MDADDGNACSSIDWNNMNWGWALFSRYTPNSVLNLHDYSKCEADLADLIDHLFTSLTLMSRVAGAGPTTRAA